MKHPLAEILHALADGKTVQFKYEDNPTWFDFQPKHLDINPLYAYVPNVEWRVKPSTVIINNIECPAGIDVAQTDGTMVWIADIFHIELVSTYNWDSTNTTLARWFEQGLLHLSKENASKMAKAMLAFKVAE